MRNAKDFLPRHTAAQLNQRLVLHQRLLDEARRAVPDFLRGHCQCCWLNSRDQLVIQVSGQEYAAQLRFFLAAIREGVQKATGVHVHQVVLRPAIPEAQAVSKPIGSLTAAHLIAEEAGVCDVPEISGALRRLAASVARRSERN